MAEEKVAEVNISADLEKEGAAEMEKKLEDGTATLGIVEEKSKQQIVAEMKEKRKKIISGMSDMQKALCMDFCDLASSMTRLYNVFDNDPDTFIDAVWSLMR